MTRKKMKFQRQRLYVVEADFIFHSRALIWITETPRYEKHFHDRMIPAFLMFLYPKIRKKRKASSTRLSLSLFATFCVCPPKAIGMLG